MDNNKAIEQYDLPSTDQLKLIDQQDLSKVDFETRVQMGMDAQEMKGYSQWLLGKLAHSVTHPSLDQLEAEGEETETEIKARRGALKDYAARIKANYNTLTNYASIYRKFTAEDPNFHPLQYHGLIPWGVLALVANKSDTPVTLLKELEDKDMVKSLEQAAFAIKEKQQTEPATEGTVSSIPAKPKIELAWNPNRELYELVMDPQDFKFIDFSKVKEDLRTFLEGLD